MTMSLFEDPSNIELSEEPVGPGATILRNFAISEETEILSGLSDVVSKAPFRHMITPGGFRMSVAMTNCGALGWVTDRTGYRYDPMDPESGLPWPPMPESFLTLARNAAAKAGFKEFVPDACLINRYDPGARLTLHQDKNERDFDQPIVSVSLGLPATFLFGGLNRTDTAVRVKLTHGDVAVWGGSARLRYHGVLPLKAGHHPSVGGYRINLTFRQAVSGSGSIRVRATLIGCESEEDGPTLSTPFLHDSPTPKKGDAWPRWNSYWPSQPSTWDARRTRQAHLTLLCQSKKRSDRRRRSG